MKVLKIISLLVLSFWLISSFMATVRDEKQSTRIATFIMFILTIIPFYYIYIK